MAAKPGSIAAAQAIQPSGFVVLRAPLLPYDELRALSDTLRAPGAPPEQLDGAVAADRRYVRERLRALVARPEVAEALLLASPTLSESLEAWQRDPDGARGQKVERTLTRYLARMAARPTPFGMFAGCATGTVAAATKLALPPSHHFRRHVRLDSEQLSAIIERLVAAPELQATVRLRPNNSLYESGEALRYAEVRRARGARAYELVAVDVNDAVAALVARAATGATRAELVEHLVRELEADPDDAAEFVEEVIRSQLLVPELGLTLTGAEPLEQLLATLRGAGPESPARRTLERVRDELAQLETAPPADAIAGYARVGELVAMLDESIDRARLLQVDLYRPAAEVKLGPEPIAELMRVVGLLQSVAPPSIRGSKLEEFRRAFVERYDAREVPLGEALDSEAGVGFGALDEAQADGSPLLAGLGFGGAEGAQRAVWGGRHQLLLRKLTTALSRGEREVVLDDADWAELRSPDPQPLPDAFAVVATLLARDAAACDRGEFRLLLDGVPGPSGATLLGRFCHGDATLAAAVGEHLRAEEALYPGAIFAEIVHLPEQRIGNLLQRPRLRDYEIPYLGSSGAPLDHQIPLSDLLVSVVGDRVVLRSRRLNREVVPRLSTAHHFGDARNLRVYQFLCALQFQNMGSLGFGWGPLESAPYLPRLVSGRWIIARARWRLDAGEIDALDRVTPAERFAAVQALRAGRGLPRRVALVDDDQSLHLDLDNALFVESFIELARRKRRVTLLEVLDDGELCAASPDGAFTHELVVPFVRARPAPSRPERARPRVPASDRTFAVGSAWLYAKIYCGPATADGVLVEELGPFARSAVAEELADEWFFLRYADPDWHLRLRFHGRPEMLVRELLPRLGALAQRLVARGVVWRWQLDTYEREVERYGGLAGVRLAERLFCADSDAALDLVTFAEHEGGRDARWQLALVGIDRLLDDLGLGVVEKHALMRDCRAHLGRRLGATPALDRALGTRYRNERLALEALLLADEAHPFAPGLAALARRGQHVRPIAAELSRLGRGGARGMVPAELCASFVHMFANRMFRAAAQQHECVLYDFLLRLYESQLARRQRAPLAVGPIRRRDQLAGS